MLYPCDQCKRIIRDDETRCPFCEATTTPPAVTGAAPVGLSRREMVAFAATAMVVSACEEIQPEPEPKGARTPQPKASAAGTASATATATATASATAAPTASAAPSASATATASATPRAKPTATPKPNPVKVIPRPPPKMPYGCPWADPDESVSV